MLGARNSWTLSAGLLFLCLLTFHPSARGQLARMQVGSSDMIPSQGGSIALEGPNYNAYLGAGVIDRKFTFGTYFKTSVHSYDFTLGDAPIAFGLPTDIFDTNHYFLGRGIAVSTKVRQASLFLFAGDTAQAFGTPFFQAAQATSAAKMFFADIPLSDKLHLSSRNVFSRQQTSIQALDWQPRAWLKTAVAGGSGSNHPYFAATLDAERDWLSLKAAYVDASDKFRRITVQSPLAPELDRENLVVSVKPFSGAVLIAGRQNLLQPQSDPNAAFLHATVNQLQTSFDAAQFRFGGGLFQSTARNQRNLGEAFWASRQIVKNIDAGVNYYSSRSQFSTRVSNISASIRETVSPRLGLLQIVNHSAGRTNVLFGGNYVNNRFTIGVDYQTIYLPFRSNPFSQGISVTLRFRLFSRLELNAQTYRGTDGKLRYTTSGSTFLNRGLPVFSGNRSETYKLPKYIIRGHVQDERSNPVGGAAIRIGQEIVYTNADGDFFVREKKPGVLPLQVALGEFLSEATFEVVSAPATAVSAPDATASDLLVVLGPARANKQR